MNTFAKYASQALIASELKSYNALAKKLGITSASVSQFRNGQAKPGESTLIRLGEAAGVDPLQVVAEFKLETAKDYKVVQFWKSLQQQVAASFLAVAMLGGGGIADTVQNFSGMSRALYIMSTRIVCMLLKSISYRPADFSNA